MSKTAAGAETLLSSTPYDDVFRTLLNECGKLIIPVINEVFGEEYTGEETIQFSPNEHFLHHQGGGTEKRITDTNFVVIGKTTKRYHLECQSTIDYSILIRIFEYDAQIALDQSREIIGNRIIVSFPNTAVLFLRSTSKTPDVMQIVIRTPGGEVSYDVPVMKIRSYTIEEIFEKKLLFLIPFYLFTYEGRFREMDEDADQVAELTAQYRKIMARLEQLAGDGVIDAFDRMAIMDMSAKVLTHLAVGYEHIRKGVEPVMVGQVLDFEAKRIKNAAREEGLEEGRAEGREEGVMETLIALVEKGLLSIKDAAMEADTTEAAFRQIMASR